MRLTKRQTALSLLFAMAMTAGLMAAQQPAYDLSYAPDGESNLVSVDLTAEIFQRLGGHSESLRLYGRDGQAIPYLLEQQKTVRREVQRAGQLTITQVRTMEDGSLMLMAQSEKPFWNPAHLTFNTTVKDFEQEVQVFGSTDGQTWRTLCADGFIFDSTRNLKARNLDVTFDPGDCTRFRIVLNKANLERESAFREMHRNWSEKDGREVDEAYVRQIQAFQLESVTMWSEQIVESGFSPTWQEAATEIIRQERGQDADGRPTTILTIRPACYPVTALTITCSQTNFSRRASASAVISGHANPVPLVDNAQLRAVKIGGYELDERTLSFSSVNEGDILLTLHDGDNPPLPITAVSARIPRFRLLFLGDAAGGGYKLSTQPNAAAPAYDTGDITAMLGQKIAPVEARAAATETDVADAPPPRAAAQFPKWALYVILALVIAILGWINFRTMKKASEGQK